MIKRVLHFVYILGYFLFGGVWYARKRGVSVGRDCRLYVWSWGSEPFLITIGDRVTVTSGVRLLTHDGATCLVSDGNYRYYDYGPISIGHDVFIGTNAILMPGVEIGDRVIIGAGSVVTKSVPSNSVAVGVPAKVIGSFDSYANKVRGSCPSGRDLSGAFVDRVHQAIRVANEKRT